MKKLNIKLSKKAIFFSLALLMALVGLIGTTVAWLTSTGKNEQTFVMGEVNYTISSTTTASNKVVVPGENIFFNNKITLNNKSTVKTQVRISVTVTDTTGTPAPEIPQAAPLISIFKIGFGSNQNWVQTDPADEYYYYNAASTTPSDAQKGEVAVGTPSSGTDIDFPIEMAFDGAKVGNEYKNRKYTITITFQAKQLENVSWSEMGSINFGTGLAN